MVVRYNALDRFEAPIFTLCQPGSTYVDGKLTKAVGALIDHEAEEIVFNFNALSELNMRVNMTLRDDPEENEHARRLFKLIMNRRLIYVENIGYFVITHVSDGYDNNVNYKDVTAKSVDVELEQKMIPYIADGTYRFSTDVIGGNKGILETIIETLPLWTIGHVDSSIAAKWRTFNDIETTLNCRGFLIDNIQEAYECIIVFDIIHRIINVYARDTYIKETDIHITKQDLINSITVDENADDIYTAISALGEDSVSIAAVNPLGTNVIYAFDYYLSWMPDTLRNKVVAWQTAIDERFDEHYKCSKEYYQQLELVSGFEHEINRLNTQITMYKRCRDNIVAESSTDIIQEYNTVIEENGGETISIDKEIDETLQEIDKLLIKCNEFLASTQVKFNIANQTLEIKKSAIDNIHNQLDVSQYFTSEEYTELCLYIYEGSYNDEYVIITESMTYEEKFEQMKLLYDRAKSQLDKVSVPTQEFDIDVESFIFNKDFANWSEQLETGCLINVEFDTDDIAQIFLSSITVNYDDHTMKLTFGNRYNKFDPQSLFDNMLGNISKSANTINSIKEAIYPIKNGEFNAIREGLQTSKDLTMSNALAAANEEVVIDASGYTGKRLLPSGEYDDRQIKIVSNSIVFTDDGWDSCSLALGSIVLDDGTAVYGINAQAIFGDMIIGGGLKIYDNKGNELLSVIDGIEAEVNGEDGKFSQLSQKVDSLTLSVSNGGESSTLSLKSGNITLSSAKIEMTGFVTFTDLSTSGSTTIHGGNIATGTLSADSITSGTLDADKVTVKNLNADSITGGKLSGTYIDGSTLIITSGANIAGWNLDANSICKYTDNWGTGTFMCTGSNSSYSIGGSGTRNGWVFGAGGKFGVTSDGAVYCSNLHTTGGSVGGWVVGANYIRTSSGVYGTHTWNDNGALSSATGYLFTALTSLGVQYAVSGSNSYAAATSKFHSSCLISSTAFNSGGGSVET